MLCECTYICLFVLANMDWQLFCLDLIALFNVFTIISFFPVFYLLFIWQVNLNMLVSCIVC